MIATQKPLKQALPACNRMTVTPEMAARWLESANTHNRPVSDAYVERLARDMRNGQWKLTHEGIAFDSHGVLLDGQNRLWAVVQANVSVAMHVWFNVTPESLMVINSGKPRSLADNLRLSGRCGEVTKNDLATLRAMLGRGGDTSLTASQLSKMTSVTVTCSLDARHPPVLPTPTTRPRSRRMPLRLN